MRGICTEKKKNVTINGNPLWTWRDCSCGTTAKAARSMQQDWHVKCDTWSCIDPMVICLQKLIRKHSDTLAMWSGWKWFFKETGNVNLLIKWWPAKANRTCYTQKMCTGKREQVQYNALYHELHFSAEFAFVTTTWYSSWRWSPSIKKHTGLCYGNILVDIDHCIGAPCLETPHCIAIHTNMFILFFFFF